MSQLITHSQLQQYDGVKNSQLWILLYGKVYDITEFADKHPGGREMIETACARDSTALFESYHLSSQSISKLFLRDENTNSQSSIKYIGEFDETTTPKEEDPTEATVKFNFTDYKSANKQEDRKMNIYEILKEQLKTDLFIPALTRQDFNLSIRRVSALRLLNAIFIFSGLLACQLLSQYVTGLHLSLAIMLASFAGVFHHLALVHVAHDAGHGSFTDFPTVWRMIGHCCSYMLGQSFYLWTIRHNIGHHVYTNMSEIDPDISIYERGIPKPQERSPDKIYPKTGMKRSTPIKIMSITGPNMFLPVMYSLVIVYMQLKDLAHYWRRRVSDGVGFASSTWSFTTFHFYTSKIVFVLYRLILPIVVHYFTGGNFGRSAFESVLLFSVSEVVAGLLFGLLSQINHISEQCKFSHLREGAFNNRDEMDWATVQITTSVDYCHDSYVWTYLSGFLNHQVVHHLFPSINPWLYPKIVPIVKKVCLENNIAYTVYDNFWDALTAHVRQVASFVNKNNALPKLD